MIKYVVAAAALVLAGVPAAFGVADNASFTRDVPIRIPAQARISTPSPSAVPEAAEHPAPAEPRDVRTQEPEPSGTSTAHVEAGDDNGQQVEPGDDNSQAVEPGDDTTQHSEPGDDHHRSGSGSGHGGGSDDAGSRSDGGSAPVSGTGGGSGTDDH